MALREERPADFTDEERWGVHWLSTPALIAGLVLLSASALICRLCMRLHILPFGIVLSFLLIVPGTVIFILPIPEGDLWHGQGTMVAKILARRPLPAHVVCFGDIAYHWGQPEDYALAAKLFQPLLDAGIKLTLGLGNHDRRDNFLVQWPSYAKSTLVPGRIVSKVEMPHVDLLMLDTSSAKSVEKKSKSHPGDCSKEERDWLAETLKAATKPVITCSHHRPNEDKVGLADLLHGSSACKWHVFGHWHRWFRDLLHVGWNPQ